MKSEESCVMHNYFYNNTHNWPTSFRQQWNVVVEGIILGIAGVVHANPHDVHCFRQLMAGTRLEHGVVVATLAM